MEVRVEMLEVEVEEELEVGGEGRGSRLFMTVGCWRMLRAQLSQKIEEESRPRQFLPCFLSTILRISIGGISQLLHTRN